MAVARYLVRIDLRQCCSGYYTECDQNNWLVVNSVIHAVSICRNPIGKERLFTLFLS